MCAGEIVVGQVCTWGTQESGKDLRDEKVLLVLSILKSCIIVSIDGISD